LPVVTYCDHPYRGIRLEDRVHDPVIQLGKVLELVNQDPTQVTDCDGIFSIQLQACRTAVLSHNFSSGDQQIVEVHGRLYDQLPLVSGICTDSEFMEGAVTRL